MPEDSALMYSPCLRAPVPVLCTAAVAPDDRRVGIDGEGASRLHESRFSARVPLGLLFAIVDSDLQAAVASFDHSGPGRLFAQGAPSHGQDTGYVSCALYGTLRRPPTMIGHWQRLKYDYSGWQRGLNYRLLALVIILSGVLGPEHAPDVIGHVAVGFLRRARCLMAPGRP